MFNFYSPLVHPVHHFIAGPLALNTKILQYGTVKDQLPQVALMDRLLTVLGLCYDSLKEGDCTPCNMEWNDFMIDYNARDDPRVTPKPYHRDAWQSPEPLLQFAIDVYGQHEPEGLDRKQHVNLRPAVFNKPVPASLQNYSTELGVDSPSLFVTSESLSSSDLGREFRTWTNTHNFWRRFIVAPAEVVANLHGEIILATTVRSLGEVIRLRARLLPTALVLVGASKIFSTKLSSLFSI